MKHLILFFTLILTLFSADFSIEKLNYKAIDKNFTYTPKTLKTTNNLTCGCGVPAKLLPYHGENIPLAKTEPCLENGCQKVFIFESFE